MSGVIWNYGMYSGTIGPADEYAYYTVDMSADYDDDAVYVTAVPECSDVLVDDRSTFY